MTVRRGMRRRVAGSGRCPLGRCHSSCAAAAGAEWESSIGCSRSVGWAFRQILIETRDDQASIHRVRNALTCTCVWMGTGISLTCPVGAPLTPRPINHPIWRDSAIKEFARSEVMAFPDCALNSLR